ncbi:Uncharacterised protein [Legionella israelensis]|uniref:Uncharacterized protein n=2 Tax=Legionella israelensis TaxID=454 RepID=A0A0W0V7F8_9GAMM|nr:hypothetical protein [Legionella israelensis]KTD16040.1 hypothetical protein Lisr_2187 [Legionella israelensis]SCY05122.1 hypothetical protein SAMN02746069_01112 [Legionella israelensis DSM 19235]STX58521.1 Uncharacterised protein [Legionella israelensis]
MGQATGIRKIEHRDNGKTITYREIENKYLFITIQNLEGKARFKRDLFQVKFGFFTELC